MSISNTVKEYKEIRSTLRYLLEGVVVSIDPSCGSDSSMPGYAVSRAGVIVDSGIVQLDKGRELPYRLQELSYKLGKLFATWQPDVLVYEQIAPRRYGGGSAHGHASLLKAVGVTLSIPGPTQFVGLRPTQWTRYKSSSYVKGDEADAREMIRIVLETAREIVVTDPPRSYGRTAGAAGGIDGTGRTSTSRKRGTGTSKAGASRSKARGTGRTSRRVEVPPY